METVKYKKNEYRYVTVAVDSYENRNVQGRILHSALEKEAGFGGWIDFMRVINQIYDKTQFPKQTVNIRTFGPLQKRELLWKERESEDVGQSSEGSLWTFTFWLRYRYHASWQGTVRCLRTKCSYKFESFLELLQVMDCILQGRSPGVEETGDARCICRLAANVYDGGDIQGELQMASLNWRKELTSIAGLIENMSELSDILKAKPDHGILITGESLNCYRRGGQKATFVIHIMYRQHSTWQGILHCREQKTEKTFRSFMEMLYLMASALEIDETYKNIAHNSGETRWEHQRREYRIQKQIEQVI